ncbi:DNA-directed RNA polymerase subunit delta [Bacillus niameyensis]|uniref:DNA-directed RNA polymerase subunit delta n=1 Tax=Bacillus niameyensis TaxID=1522308 RepID=UPI0007836233|nr:DNA-directed RNA polymerase subunit delta [Bacillus niameyensis]
MLQLSKEELKEMSLIEIAFQMFEEKRETISFQRLLDEMAAALELSPDEMQSRMVQFYTDLNVDGRFISLGENRWGLRDWYPMDQIDDEVIVPTKPKKKKKKSQQDDDEFIEDIEDEDFDLDEDEDFGDDEEEEEDESLEVLREEEFEDDEDFEEDAILEEDEEFDAEDEEDEEFEEDEEE